MEGLLKRDFGPRLQAVMKSALDIYTGAFGLAERPFSLVPDPGFLFWSAVHQRAYSMLEYGVLTRAPITLITGDVGTGKTTLLHHLMKSVGEDVRVGLIANAHGDRATGGPQVNGSALGGGDPASQVQGGIGSENRDTE